MGGTSCSRNRSGTTLPKTASMAILPCFNSASRRMAKFSSVAKLKGSKYWLESVGDVPSSSDRGIGALLLLRMDRIREFDDWILDMNAIAISNAVSVLMCTNRIIVNRFILL